ncbi:hypothetical protein GGF32_001986 [Allomyces javanicus]|nr:hypothetical protein GGF32_001986 [Allomyces javanicus]
MRSSSPVTVIQVVSDVLAPLLITKNDALNLRTTCRALALNRDLLDRGCAAIPSSKSHDFLASFKDSAELLDFDQRPPRRIFYSLPHVAASVQSLSIAAPEREVIAVSPFMDQSSLPRDMADAAAGLLAAFTRLEQLRHLEIPAYPTQWSHWFSLSQLQVSPSELELGSWAHQINQLPELTELTIDTMSPTEECLTKLAPTLLRLRSLHMYQSILRPSVLGVLRNALFPPLPNQSLLETLVIDSCVVDSNAIGPFLQTARHHVRVLDVSHLSLSADELSKIIQPKFPDTRRALTLRAHGTPPRNPVSWVQALPMQLTHVNLADFRLPWSVIQVLIGRPHLQWAAVKPGPDPPARNSPGSARRREPNPQPHSASMAPVPLDTTDQESLPAGLILSLDWDHDAKMAAAIRLVRTQDPPTLVTLHFRKLQSRKRPRVRYHVGGPPMLQRQSPRPAPPPSIPLGHEVWHLPTENDRREWSVVWSLGRRHLDRIRRERLVYDAVEDACITEDEARELQYMVDGEDRGEADESGPQRVECNQM